MNGKPVTIAMRSESGAAPATVIESSRNPRPVIMARSHCVAAILTWRQSWEGVTTRVVSDRTVCPLVSPETGQVYTRLVRRAPGRA